MSDANICPRCGTSTPADAEPGLCPRCLLVRGIEGFADDEPGPRASAAITRFTDDATPLCSFGDYELLEEIGRGGMGIVYRARQKGLNRIVALKIILAGRWASEAQVERFRAEAEAAAALAHPNIVPIYEVGERQGQQFFSMKLVEGGSLAAKCEVRNEKDEQTGRLALRMSALLLQKIARAVHFAHQRGIVHRDLKPTNVLIDREGEPHLTDFGLAKRLESGSHLTHTQTVLGTPAYMAPEQAAGRNDQVTVAADIYSLGAILYEMLAGQPPFTGATPLDVLQQVRERNPRPLSSLNRTVPRDLEIICLKCLQKEPRRRYATAADLADDLDRWLTGRPILARPVPLPERLWLWTRRNPAAACAVALSFLLAAGSLMTAFRFQRESGRVRKAEREATEKLRASYLAQARAERLSGMAGRRARSLEAIAAAADIRPSIELRNEAIAALALLDLGPPVMWRGPSSEGSFKRTLVASDLDIYAASAGREGIHVYRTEGGAAIAQFGAPALSPLQWRFSPDGRQLAAAYRGGNVFVWNLDQPGIPPRTNYVKVDDAAHPLAFTRDGKILLVAGADRKAHFYKVNTGEEVQQIAIGVVPFHLEFDPAGEFLAVMSGGDVHLWDVRRQERIRSMNHPAGGTLLDWHPDGRLLAIGHGNGDLQIWDTTTGEVRPLVGHTQYVSGLEFDPLGEFLGSQSWDGTPHFWEPASGQPLFRMQHAGVQQVGRTGQRIAFRNDDGSGGALEITRSKVFKFVSSVNTRYPHLRGVDLSRDGRWLLTGEKSGWRLFDVKRRAEAGSVEHNALVSPFFHPGSRFVLTVEPDRLLRWPLEVGASSDGVRAGSPEIMVSEPGSEFQRGCVSSDGSLVAVAGHRRSLLIDWNDPSRIVRFSKGRSQSFASLSPDKRWVAAASAVGGGVTIWDTRDGNLLRQIVPRDNAQIALSRDGRTLATATPRECVLWDTQSWTSRQRWELGLSGGVPVPVTFSADGAWVAVAATRMEVRLLDARTGTELATLTPPLPQSVNTLVFSEDGRYLAGETFARAVHLWDLHSLRRELAAMKLDW